MLVVRCAHSRGASQAPCISLCRSDCIISESTVDSGAWRAVSEDSLGSNKFRITLPRVFPADCPHLTDCHCHLLERGEYRRIQRSFQQIVRFINVTTMVIVYSYGRRLPGLRSGALPCG